MKRAPVTALLVAVAVALTGCASAQTTKQPASNGSASSRMSSGMVMPDASTKGAAGQASPEAIAADQPSAAEQMVCGSEIHQTLVTILGLAHSPTSHAVWADHLYTCTYRLPMGTLIVSVKRSSDPTAAHTYFSALRPALGPTEPLQGLGQGSFGTTPGRVVLIKDSDVLTVDATKLPAVFGTQQSKRFDFAYELASDILGCWTGG